MERHWYIHNPPRVPGLEKRSRQIGAAEAAGELFLPNLRRSNAILIGCDIGGLHRDSQYEAYSFVVVDPNDAGHWQTQQRCLRSEMFPDGREMYYEKLQEPVRSRVLGPFLDAANTLHGVLATFLVNKDIPRLFFQPDRSVLTSRALPAYRDWNPYVFERALRVALFSSLLLSGLFKAGQQIRFIVDEDDIVANEKQLSRTSTLIDETIRHILPYMPSELLLTTAAEDRGDFVVKDFLAIPDFAAGALSEVLTSYHKSGLRIPARLFVAPPAQLPDKTRRLMSWFAATWYPLKRLTFVVDPSDQPTSQVWTLLHVVKVPRPVTETTRSNTKED